MKFLLDVAKCVFAVSLLLRNVIFQKSVIKVELLYTIMLAWTSFDTQLITKYLLFILRSCLKVFAGAVAEFS